MAAKAAGAIRRMVAELRAAPTARDADAALARLRVRFESADGNANGTLAVIDESDDGEPLAALEDRRVDAVRLARNVYARVPTAAGRVRLLSLASRVAPEIALHVVISDDGSHVGRVAIDTPRRILRAIGAQVAEPGDRFGRERYAHCFFDEETLLDEVRDAGLAVAARRGFVFSLRRADARDTLSPSEHAEPFTTEVARVARRVRAIETKRLHDTPERVLGELRAGGATMQRRGPIGRARLRRAIGWVDAVVPGGPNCLRRVLLEVALDAGAANETVVFGLDVGSTGHVAFEDREERTFDVAFRIPPPAARRAP
jgi:hypothetical protein